MVSLAASAALSALGQELAMRTPIASIMLSVLNTGVSLVVFAILFAAIYKMLPDKPLRWRDVAIGALVTALFTTGKSLIGWYLAAPDLWRRGRADRAAAVGLLFGPDFSIWRRTYQGNLSRGHARNQPTGAQCRPRSLGI
jgi:membrane protein